MFTPSSQMPGIFSPRSYRGWLFLTLQVSTVVWPFQRGLLRCSQHIILDTIILFVYLPLLYCMLRRVGTVLFTTDSPVPGPYFSKDVVGQLQVTDQSLNWLKQWNKPEMGPNYSHSLEFLLHFSGILSAWPSQCVGDILRHPCLMMTK